MFSMEGFRRTGNEVSHEADIACAPILGVVMGDDVSAALEYHQTKVDGREMVVYPSCLWFHVQAAASKNNISAHPNSI